MFRERRSSAWKLRCIQRSAARACQAQRSEMPLTRRWSGPRRRYSLLAVERRACAAAAAQRHYVMRPPPSGNNIDEYLDYFALSLGRDLTDDGRRMLHDVLFQGRATPHSIFLYVEE